MAINGVSRLRLFPIAPTCCARTRGARGAGRRQAELECGGSRGGGSRAGQWRARRRRERCPCSRARERGGRLGWPWLALGGPGALLALFSDSGDDAQMFPPSAAGAVAERAGVRTYCRFQNWRRAKQRTPRRRSAGVPPAFRRRSAGVPHAIRTGAAPVPQPVPHRCRTGAAPAPPPFRSGSARALANSPEGEKKIGYFFRLFWCFCAFGGVFMFFGGCFCQKMPRRTSAGVPHAIRTVLRTGAALVPHLCRACAALVPYLCRTCAALVPHLCRTCAALVPHCGRICGAAPSGAKFNKGQRNFECRF